MTEFAILADDGLTHNLMVGNDARISMRLPVDVQRNRGLIGRYDTKLLLHDWRCLVEDKRLAENSATADIATVFTHFDATVWRPTLQNVRADFLLKLMDLGITSEGSKDELHFPP